MAVISNPLYISRFVINVAGTRCPEIDNIYRKWLQYCTTAKHALLSFTLPRADGNYRSYATSQGVCVVPTHIHGVGYFIGHWASVASCISVYLAIGKQWLINFPSVWMYDLCTVIVTICRITNNRRSCLKFMHTWSVLTKTNRHNPTHVPRITGGHTIGTLKLA